MTVPSSWTVAVDGCVVMVGATSELAALTVSVAVLDEAEPTELVKTARYCLPVSPVTVAGVV